MDLKVLDSIGPQVLQEMYDKMDLRSVKEQLEKSGNSTSSSGNILRTYVNNLPSIGLLKSAMKGSPCLDMKGLCNDDKITM